MVAFVFTVSRFKQQLLHIEPDLSCQDILCSAALEWLEKLWCPYHTHSNISCCRLTSLTISALWLICLTVEPIDYRKARQKALRNADQIKAHKWVLYTFFLKPWNICSWYMRITAEKNSIHLHWQPPPNSGLGIMRTWSCPTPPHAMLCWAQHHIVNQPLVS